MNTTEIQTELRTLADEMDHPLLQAFLADLAAETVAELRPCATNFSWAVELAKFPLGLRLSISAEPVDYEALLEHPEATPTPNVLCITINETYSWGQLPVQLYCGLSVELPREDRWLLQSIGKIRKEYSTYDYIAC